MTFALGCLFSYTRHTESEDYRRMRSRQGRKNEEKLQNIKFTCQGFHENRERLAQYLVTRWRALDEENPFSQRGQLPFINDRQIFHSARMIRKKGLNGAEAEQSTSNCCMHTFLTSHPPYYKVDVRTIINVDSDCVEECVLRAHEAGTIQQIVEPSDRRVVNGATSSIKRKSSAESNKNSSRCDPMSILINISGCKTPGFRKHPKSDFHWVVQPIKTGGQHPRFQ